MDPRGHHDWGVRRMSRRRSGDGDQLRGIKLALALYVAIFAGKLAVYLVTGVLALLAEALHTLADIVVASFLLLAAFYAHKLADETHMFGHGRAENVAGLVAAVFFVSFTAYKLYEESIPRLFHADEASYQNLGLAVAVLVASMLVIAAPALVILRQQQRGAAVRAQLLELVNDELGLLAALAATVFVMLGKPLADPIASLVVATIIVIDAAFLFRSNASMLLGRSPGPEYLSRVEQAARSVDGVVGVRDLVAEYVGPEIVHAGMHLQIRPGMSVEEASRVADEVRRRVHDGADTGYCLIEVEAAPPGPAAGRAPRVGHQ